MFQLPGVLYEGSGLPGFLSSHQITVHHQKHHKLYVDTANKLIEDSNLKGKPIEEIIQQAEGPLFNNVAQHFNHDFYWKCLCKEQKEMPQDVAEFLNKNFQSVDGFKEQFIQKASTIFGSGWCYLAKNRDGSISINQYSNALNPIKEGGKPLLTIDTWEHAYYIDYENQKAEYFKNFWKYVNWEFVRTRLHEAGEL